MMLLLSAYSAYAGGGVQKEKVVTTKWSFVTGDATVTNHYLSDQEYNGAILGIGTEFGSFYKRNENLSWKLDITYVSSPYSSHAPELSVSNPAGTSFYSMHNINADYGTYYNWNPAKNLFLKAGGSFNLVTGFTMGKPNHVNNMFDVDFQTQLQASAGVRYGWNFKKFGLFLQGDIALPFMGFAMSGSQYQGTTDTLVSSGILPGTVSILHFTSFHNLTGFNFDLELDFVFNKTTLFFAIESYNRWWNITGLQNYRVYSMNKIGLMVDLVARKRHNSDNRYF